MKEKKVDIPRRWGCVTILVVYLLWGAVIVWLLCGCTVTRYVPVENSVTRTDTVYSAKIRVDSVIIHDSVTVTQRGDTVFRDRYVDRYRVKERTDTVFQTVTDSVRTEVPYPVERKLTQWEQTKMDLGGVAIVVLAVMACIAVVWLIRKFRK